MNAKAKRSMATNRDRRKAEQYSIPPSPRKYPPVVICSLFVLVGLILNLKAESNYVNFILLDPSSTTVTTSASTTAALESEFTSSLEKLDSIHNNINNQHHHTKNHPHHYPQHQQPPPDTATATTSTSSTSNSNSIQTCAPHLKEPAQRKVLFVGASNWDGFYNGTYTIHSQSKTQQLQNSYFRLNKKPQKEFFGHQGEAYVFASLDWSLRQLGFTVEATKDFLEDFTPQELSQYHRIFQNTDQPPPPSLIANHPEIVCKLRFLHFWGNWKSDTNNLNDNNQWQWDPRQALSPYPESFNTFLGYFVHSLVLNNNNNNNNNHQTQATNAPRDTTTTKSTAALPSLPKLPASSFTPSNRRPKEGFLLGKKPFIFQDPQNHKIVRALLEDGFVLHSTCSNYDVCNYLGTGSLANALSKTFISNNKECKPNCGLPPQVVVHGKMSPQVYANLLGRMSFMIGFGDPIVSPSPLEGLAHGTAFLNPLGGTNNPKEKQKWILQPQQQQSRPATTTNHHRFHQTVADSNRAIKDSQHRPIALLGMPYVYNIDLQNVTTVLQAANWAVQHRFPSYTPPDYRPEAMMARACGIMADDAICQCQLSSSNNYNQNDGAQHNSPPPPDCRGNTYIRTEENR